MKWFKHLTNYRRHPFVRQVTRKFRQKGTLAWLFVIETIAEHWEVESGNTTYTQCIDDWLLDLHLHRNSRHTLIELLEFAQSHRQVTFELHNEYLTVDFPQIIEMKDEFSRQLLSKSGVAHEESQSQNQSQSENQSKSQIKTRRAADAAPKPAKVEVVHQLGVIWNEHRGTLPACKSTSGARAKKCSDRWRENSDTAYWKSVIEKIAASDFCRGKSSSGWRATFDWFIQPETHVKVLEGKYDNHSNRDLEKTAVQKRSANNQALAEKIMRGEL